jgi:hypothetical protein
VAFVVGSTVPRLSILIAVIMVVLVGTAWFANPVHALPHCPLEENCPEPPDRPEPPLPEPNSVELYVSEHSVVHTDTEWLGSFTVSNAGDRRTQAGAFQVVVAEGTSVLQTYDVPRLRGGQGQALTFSLPYSPSDCRVVDLTVTVDSFNTVIESDEDNNIKSIVADPCPPPPPAVGDDRKVWRAQIRLVTGNVGDAGTDDSVRVELGSGNGTWIDYGRDDFERNDDFTYDLNLDNIATLGDISMLRISKPGNDGWCLRSLELIINGRPIYSRSSETFPKGCWLHSPFLSETLTISDVALHAHSLWQNFQQPSPSPIIPREEMERRIEGIMGDKVYYNSLEWGHLYGRAVEATRQDGQALRMDLDLEYHGVVTPEVDVDFDLRFSCQEGTIEIRTENLVVNVDSPWWQEVLTLGIAEYVDRKVRRGIERAFDPITESLDTGTPFCPNITVQENGDILFTLP